MGSSVLRQGGGGQSFIRPGVSIEGLTCLVDFWMDLLVGFNRWYISSRKPFCEVGSSVPPWYSPYARPSSFSWLSGMMLAKRVSFRDEAEPFRRGLAELFNQSMLSCGLKHRGCSLLSIVRQ